MRKTCSGNGSKALAAAEAPQLASWSRKILMRGSSIKASHAIRQACGEQDRSLDRQAQSTRVAASAKDSAHAATDISPFSCSHFHAMTAWAACCALDFSSVGGSKNSAAMRAATRSAKLAENTRPKPVIDAGSQKSRPSSVSKNNRRLAGLAAERRAAPKSDDSWATGSWAAIAPPFLGRASHIAAKRFWTSHDGGAFSICGRSMPDAVRRAPRH